jgi:site-specific recombinase XerD
VFSLGKTFKTRELVMLLSQPLFVRRLGLHHFAYLRSIAEGLDLVDTAKKYLGIEHGNQAKAAHDQVTDAVRAIARRRGDKAWRLIGLTIKLNISGSIPTLDDFIAERDLYDWGQAEISEMYEDAYPVDKKTERREKLRRQQVLLLKEIEGQAAETPSPNDLVSGWFDDVTAKKLIGAGMINLGELNRKVAIGGAWYSGIAAIGESKAERIKAHLRTLLPAAPAPEKSLFILTDPRGQLRLKSPQGSLEVQSSSPLPCLGILTPTPLLDADTDDQAVDSWIAARAGSKPTVITYKREATRLLLWLKYERHGKALGQMNINDCGDYMAFLQNVPDKWISRNRAAPGKLGWAPFRGQLSHSSHRQAVIIISSMFLWLQSAQYIQANPWVLINKKTGDDAKKNLLDTKALSIGAMGEIIKFIEVQAPSPSRSRIIFILKFLESVGLRSRELLDAELGDLRLESECWLMQVHGKGSKNRIVAIPGQAFNALQDYLESRGIGNIQSAPSNAPLLASTKDPMETVGYQALYEHVHGWLAKAVNASDLPTNERSKLSGASTHWLRHTFGTRAVSKDVPMDVIQAQMGHASIQTTMNIYGKAPIKRRVDELSKAFG